MDERREIPVIQGKINEAKRYRPDANNLLFGLATLHPINGLSDYALGVRHIVTNVEGFPDYDMISEAIRHIQKLSHVDGFRIVGCRRSENAVVELDGNYYFHGQIELHNNGQHTIRTRRGLIRQFYPERDTNII